MKLYLARDKDNTLTLFKSEPINCMDKQWIPREDIDCGNYIILPDDLYPDITWENSPKEIELNVGIKG